MKLVKILSDKVQIRSDYKEFDDVRINDLIAVSDGDVELVTMVNTLTDIDTEDEEEIGENDYILEHSSTKMLECSIIGTVKDGTFQKAIDKYPTMKVSAHRISKEEFASMLSGYTEGFCIGEYTAYEFPAFVDGNKFFQRHACIVGNTGAGKSETVAKILEQTSKLPGANVIVFDVHGEYKELSYARNIQIGGDRPFPIWMFGFTDMISNILKIKEESATVAMTALRKCYYNVCPKGKENRPVYFNYVEFVKLMKFLDEEMVGTGEVYKTGAQAGKEKIVKGDYNGKLTNIVNLLVDKARDSKYQFLFEDMPQQYLYDFMKDVLNNDVPVKNIDLSEVPHDVAIPIIGVITKLVYEIQRTYKSKDVNPVTLVCDEAHVYIPNDFSLSASQRRIKELQECNATYTGNMMDYFNSAKGKKYFTVLQGRYLKDSSFAKRGDINLNTGHHVNVTVDNGSNAGKGSTTNTTTTTTGGSGYMFSVGNVQNGSKGNDVKLLQRLLKSNGFKGKDGKNLTIDGECGTNTVYAIKKYQTKKGLSVDGCAGPATWKSILLR